MVEERYPNSEDLRKRRLFERGEISPLVHGQCMTLLGGK